MEDNELDFEEVVAPLEDADEKTDDYMNEILTESQLDEPEEEEFEKNSEGVTGDEWKEENKKKLIDQLRRERNKANAERRIANKKKKAEEAEQNKETEEEQPKPNIDQTELSYYKDEYGKTKDMLNKVEPIARFCFENKMGWEELKMGADFVRNWNTDKIGCVKKLLTSLYREGIDIERIINHDDNRLSIDDEVNRRMAPILQQQRIARVEQQSRQMLDNFLAQYPDAEAHLGEIVEVMKQLNSTNLHDAYFRLRRAYDAKGGNWFGIQEPAEPIPVQRKIQPNTRNVSPVSFEEEPTSIRDLVRRKADKYLNGEY